MQVARAARAKVFATAGSPEKREFLRLWGCQHVMDSRTLDFADEARELTEGQGVDLVLNSLSGDAIAKGISTLRPYGRFIEIGKRDIYQNRKLGMRPLRNNLSILAVDLGQAIAERPALIRSLLDEFAPSWRLANCARCLIVFSRSPTSVERSATWPRRGTWARWSCR